MARSSKTKSIVQFSLALVAVLASTAPSVFAQLGSIQGTVTENGVALQSAQVILDSSSFPNLSDVTDASGFYDFSNVPSGAGFTVRVFAPDGVVIGVAGSSLAPGETKVFDFDLARGAFEGLITEDGQPLANARVTSHSFNLARGAHSPAAGQPNAVSWSVRAEQSCS